MKKCEGGPTKWVIEFEFTMRKWSENDIITVALYLHDISTVCHKP